MPELAAMKAEFAQLEELEEDLATQLEQVREKQRDLFELIIAKEDELGVLDS